MQNIINKLQDCFQASSIITVGASMNYLSKLKNPRLEPAKPFRIMDDKTFAMWAKDSTHNFLLTFRIENETQREKFIDLIGVVSGNREMLAKL